MGKHRRDRSPRSSRRDHHKHRDRSRHRSRSRSRSRHNLSRRSPSRSSGGKSARRSSSRERFLSLLGNLLNDYFARSQSSAPSEVSEDRENPARLLPPTEESLPSEESGEAPAEENGNNQIAVGGQDGDPVDVPLSPIETNVRFSMPAVTGEENLPALEELGSGSFALELFGEEAPPSTDAAWSPIILKTTKSVVHAGLKEDCRCALLAKHEPKQELVFLGPPQLNKEILPNLSETTIVRDSNHAKLQEQVGAALNALGAGMSKLSELDNLQASVEAKAAITKIAEGIRLLADHQFRLSQSRRAFIVPSLNFLGKTVSDSAPIDDCLFGSNFAEEVNTAQSIENVARKMARKPPPPPGPPVRRPSMQQPRPQRPTPIRGTQRRQGNPRPPLHKASVTQHQKRGFRQPSCTRRSSSRSRPQTNR